MTEKRFILKENGIIDDTQLNIILDGGCDKEDMVDLLNELNDENEQLKQTIDRLTLDNTKQKKVLNATKKENEQLKQQLECIEDSFEFSCTENHIEFNKDKLKVKDNHTELILKDGKLCISVFVPQLNDYFKFFYLVTGRKMMREFINYDGDVE